MKRILIFTLVIVISFHISAAETVLGSSVLPISLNLSEGGVSYIEVGFSYNQISHFSDKVDFAVKEKHNITVKEDGSSSESDDDIYVYWKILSANSVSADLMVPSALKNDEEQSIPGSRKHGSRSDSKSGDETFGYKDRCFDSS